MEPVPALCIRHPPHTHTPTHTTHHHHPSCFDLLLRRTLGLSRYEAFLNKVDILQTLDKWERLSVADALEPCDFKDGEVVIKQGDAGNEFFIIIEGQCVVSKDGEGNVGELEQAAYFGEIALLSNDTRHATITAKGDVKCAKLDRERFERVLGPCAEVLKRNMELYDTYNK